MLVLKLRRTGKKHQPSYRLIVGERRSKVDGRFVDNLGWYNPRNKGYRFNKERILYWLGQGAQKTDTVHNLLIRAGIILGKKIAVHKTSKKNKVDQETKAKDKTMDEFTNQVPEEGQEPVEPTVPEAPVTPEAPEAPAEQPVEPMEPVVPEEPTTPEESVEQPAEPVVPEEPVAPEAPAEEGVEAPVETPAPEEQKQW